MSTPLRDESPGFHHVVTRGNNRRDIFITDRDRLVFCLTLDRLARAHGWNVLAYVLMRNHYHLLLDIGDEGLSRGMCRLNSGYARHFNAWHARVNHLFGKRYWSRRLESESQVQYAARYIVQNPRRAGITRALDAYRWSSYPAMVGRAFPDIPLAVDELLPFFGRTPTTSLAAFVAFCEEEPHITELDPPVAATVN